MDFGAYNPVTQQAGGGGGFQLIYREKRGKGKRENGEEKKENRKGKVDI